ncbi:MAG TPA: hypothetical protein VGJ44_17790 [Kribbellaceae bacterium]
MTGPDEHPHWCVGGDCAARGWHASRRLTLDLSGDSGSAINLRLVQITVGDSEPHITLAGGGGEAPAIALTVRQARILRRFLARLAELAEQ